MAIAFVAGSAGTEADSTTASLTLPTGFNSAGNMTLAAFCCQTNQTWTAPSGWTVIYNSYGTLICYRFWQSGDATSISGTVGSTAWLDSAAVCYSGVDSTTPIDGSNVCILNNSAGSGTISYQNVIKAPSVNPRYNNSQCIFLGCDPNFLGGAITLPSGYTSRQSVSSGPSLLFADKVLSTGANTGEAQTTCSTFGSSIFRAGAQIVLKQSGSASSTAAAATPTLVGLSCSAPNSTSPAPSIINQQNGDLIAVFASTAGSSITPPAGYTSVQTPGTGANLYTHTWSTGDSTTPTFTIGSSATTTFYVLTLRTVAGASGSVSADVSGSATGTGSVSVGSLIPAATDMGWFLAGTNGIASGPTFSGIAPSTMTKDQEVGYGSVDLLMWQSQVTSALGAFTLTLSVGSGTNSLSGVAALFYVVPPGVTYSLSGFTGTFAEGSIGLEADYYPSAQTGTFAEGSPALEADYYPTAQTGAFTEGQISITAAPVVASSFAGGTGRRRIKRSSEVFLEEMARLEQRAQEATAERIRVEETLEATKNAVTDDVLRYIAAFERALKRAQAREKREKSLEVPVSFRLPAKSDGVKRVDAAKRLTVLADIARHREALARETLRKVRERIDLEAATAFMQFILWDD